jgi:hypothetical protein
MDALAPGEGHDEGRGFFKISRSTRRVRVLAPKADELGPLIAGQAQALVAVDPGPDDPASE